MGNLAPGEPFHKVSIDGAFFGLYAYMINKEDRQRLFDPSTGTQLVYYAVVGTKKGKQKKENTNFPFLSTTQLHLHLLF